MIRINLLGQLRPKAAKKAAAVPLEASVGVLFFIVSIGLALVVLTITYFAQSKALRETNAKIQILQAEKVSLQQVKLQVEQFERQKAVLQQRINVIETLQRNRTSGQQLLQMIANTVIRVDTLWLTSLSRKGDELDIEGDAGSINAVANFITQMKRSGYFGKVEIKEAKENDLAKSVQTFGFSMSAAVNTAPPTEGQAQPAGTTTPPPAAKGRS